MVQRRAQGDGCWQGGNDEVVQQASPLLDEREEQDQGPFLAAASSFRRRSSPPSTRELNICSTLTIPAKFVGHRLFCHTTIRQISLCPTKLTESLCFLPAQVPLWYLFLL
jgi:hypothetical protein